MSRRQRNLFPVIALLLMTTLVQTYGGVTFAEDLLKAMTTRTGLQEISGILTTDGNKPITVNGASAMSGATILSGAVIETPDGVSATVNIPGHGTLTIQPKTQLTLTFDQNGNIRVNLVSGCLSLHVLKGTTSEVDNAQGVIGRTDPSKDDDLNICPSRKVAAVAAAGHGGLFGLGTAATVAIIGGAAGGVTAIALGTRGSNPSPSSP